MKKLTRLTTFTIALLVLGFSVSAKDTTSVNFYINVGGSVWNHFAINQNIENSHGTAAKEFAPEFGFGFLVNYKRFQYNIGLDATFNKNIKGNIPYVFVYANVNLGAKYAVLNISNQQVYLGLDLSVVPMNLDLLPKNSTVDLNNITPTTQSGEVRMSSIPVLLGPTIASGDLFPNSKFNMNVAVSYQFNIIHSKWRSKYSDIVNSPLEDGNRLKVSIIFPFNN